MKEYTMEQQRFQRNLNEVLDEVRNMLITKNEAYGDSALNPVRVFSKANPIEQIDVRIDDKLSRLARGDQAGEDVYLDLVGYLVIRRIAQKRNSEYNPT
jgi:hypothetical protein